MSTLVQEFRFLNILSIMFIFYVYDCMAPELYMPVEVKVESQMPRNLSYRQFLAAILVLGTESSSSARVASVFNM